jgi:hypothetical protein
LNSTTIIEKDGEREGDKGREREGKIDRYMDKDRLTDRHLLT